MITMQTREAEEDSVTTDKNQLKRPPTWLIDNVAKKEWRRIVKELEKINLIGNLDRNNLGGYCNAFANYVKATEILKDQTYYIDRETRNGVIVVKNPQAFLQAFFPSLVSLFYTSAQFLNVYRDVMASDSAYRIVYPMLLLTE